MTPAIKKKSIFEAALGMKTKDRKRLIEKLIESLYDVDRDQLIEGAKIAERRIRQSDRDPSRLVPEEEIMKLIAEHEQ